jgi:serine/threonine protein kinase
VGEDWTVVVGDFGLAQIKQGKDAGKKGFGSPFYMAPELLLEKPGSVKADFLRLFCCLFTLF